MYYIKESDQFSAEELQAVGGREELEYHDERANFLFECNGSEIRFIASDSGPRELNTFDNDFAWIIDELNRAHQPTPKKPIYSQVADDLYDGTVNGSIKWEQDEPAKWGKSGNATPPVFHTEIDGHRVSANRLGIVGGTQIRFADSNFRLGSGKLITAIEEETERDLVPEGFLESLSSIAGGQ